MKVFLLVWFVILLTGLSNLNAQVNDEDAFYSGTYDKDFIIENHIKKIEVSNKYNNEIFGKTNYHFSLKGHLEKIVYADTLDKIQRDLLFTKDDKGGTIKITENNFETGKANVSIFSKKYNGDQLILDSSGLTGKITYFIYDDLKRITSTLNESPTTSQIIRLVKTHQYNDKDLLIKIIETVLHPDGNSYLYKTINYSYNKDAQVIAAQNSGGTNYTYNYYDNGLLKSKNTFMPEEFNKMTMQEEYSYTFW